MIEEFCENHFKSCTLFINMNKRFKNNETEIGKKNKNNLTF